MERVETETKSFRVLVGWKGQASLYRVIPRSRVRQDFEGSQVRKGCRRIGKLR